MRIGPNLVSSLLLTALTLVVNSAEAGTRLNLMLDAGVFAKDAEPPTDNLLISGLALSVRNPLVNMELDYDLEVAVTEDFTAHNDNAAQRLVASARSDVIDEVFRVHSRMRADSVFRHVSGGYDHSFRPGFSRQVMDLATMDMSYHLLLQKPHEDAAEHLQQGYSISLRDTLPADGLNWKSVYTTTDIYRSDLGEDFRLLENRETLRMQTRYSLLPEVQLQMSGAVTRHTFASALANNAHGHQRLRTQLGAGVRWRPSARYLLDLSLHHTALSDSGERALLRRGTLSWFLRDALTLSLNYGDQLLEGRPALLLDTELRLDALAGL